MPNSTDFNHFAVNPTNIDISRSIFNMDHSVKFSANIGECIPFCCLEVLPGDTFSIDTSKVIRLQPLVAPIFDEIIEDVYFFFCPNRLVWSHWVNFMGENTDSAWAPDVEYSIPQITPPVNESTEPISGNRYWKVGTIADYLGLPVGKYSPDLSVSALPFRAYALIMDQWFRSEAVMDPVHVFVDDTNRVGSNGSDQVSDIELGGKPFIACKFFDYFTGCLPAPQRGDAVSLNLLSKSLHLPVVNNPFSALVTHPYASGQRTDDPGVHISVADQYSNDLILPVGNWTGVKSDGSISPSNSELPPSSFNNQDVYFSNLWVNINKDNFQMITINDLRSAFAIQKYLEKQARFGGRYQSFIKAFFNIDSPDGRLQRTEYLGGSRVSLNINSVESTAQTPDYPVGSVAAMSVTADQNSDFTKSFTEHGMIIGIAVARYHHSYQDSLHKMWLRKTPYEFYNPVFANLGEQAVLTQEIDGYTPNRNRVFGYQERWAEYRYQPSRIAGEFRSVYQTPLDMWHLGDHYGEAPYLSPDWLREDKTNLDRCLAVTSDVSNQILCDFYIQCKASRPMPMYSIPGLIDHH